MDKIFVNLEQVLSSDIQTFNFENKTLNLSENEYYKVKNTIDNLIAIVKINNWKNKLMNF